MLIRVYGLKVPFPLHKLDFKLVFDLRNCDVTSGTSDLTVTQAVTGWGGVNGFVVTFIDYHIYFFSFTEICLQTISEKLKQTSSQISQN